jgi:hypothetical protein
MEMEMELRAASGVSSTFFMRLHSSRQAVSFCLQFVELLGPTSVETL